jgi:hypothetical protein
MKMKASLIGQSMNMNQACQDGTSITVRQLVGEFWSETKMLYMREDLECQELNQWISQVSPAQSNAIVDLLLVVVARHVGKTIQMDLDLPVKPLSPINWREG